MVLSCARRQPSKLYKNAASLLSLIKLMAEEVRNESPMPLGEHMHDLALEYTRDREWTEEMSDELELCNMIRQGNWKLQSAVPSNLAES